MNARAHPTGRPLLDVTPNFIVADYTLTHGDIVADVRELNSWILQENGFPVSASGGAVSEGIRSHTGLEGGSDDKN